jgi:protein farnesyltransferase/geranylgeranyltransferase type-1 subunit alpha
MAAKEYSARILQLTEHIIQLNPAHYTVWLYRAHTLFALGSDLRTELEWVGGISLDNQKNYQIRHHRQLLVEHLFPTLESRAAILELARAELAFMALMFAHDSKNYHMWSYRQFLVRKLALFPSQCRPDDNPDDEVPDELANTAMLIADDVRNNSAWAHRFFLVFSDPGCTSASGCCRAADPDPAVPAAVIDRELAFATAQARRAPQNQCPWNYARGVLRKGSRGLVELAAFAAEFVTLGGDGEEGEQEVVKSSHALDFLADAWAEVGEWDRADRVLELLRDRYDRVRARYWEWRREGLREIRRAAAAASAA